MPKKAKAKEPKLNLGEAKVIGPEGMRVRIQLKPNKKASYTAYQNITVRIGKDKYEYSEAWSLNSSKTQYDTFSVPEDLRKHTYRSTAEMWIEKGGVDKSYTVGKLYSADTPWGLTKGSSKMRKVPVGTKVLYRKTVMKWSKDGTINVNEVERSKHTDLTEA
jgi:hypothetical protein|eukprot:COSAG06_NODE_6_length_38168_cov_131.592398_34_plen_162_part_00